MTAARAHGAERLKEISIPAKIFSLFGDKPWVV